MLANHSLSDNIVEEPHPQYGGRNTAHCGRNHVRDGGGDLDGHETRDAHEEAEGTLSLRRLAFMGD